MENNTSTRKKNGKTIDREVQLDKAISLNHDLNLDPLFEKCARLSVNTKTLSTSQLQRNFGISFDRAVEIISQLECFGIVSPKTGFQPHQSLVNDQQLAHILEKLEIANLLD